MVSHNRGRLPKIYLELVLALLSGVKRIAPQVVNRRGACAVDAPFLFAKCNRAVARGEGRGEMDVAHFGERVADRIVGGAFTNFATLDVGDRNAQGQRYGGRRPPIGA